MAARSIALAGSCLRLLFCLLPVAAFAQATGHVSLEVRVYDEGRRALYHGNATVELLDSWATVEAQRDTSHASVLQFYTAPGAHYLRISGEDIETNLVNFEIPEGELSHVENLEVQRKVPLASAPSNDQPVPAIRLRIPKKARKQFDAGAKELEHQHWAAAAARFAAAVQLYPQYDMAYNGLGLAALSVGDLGKARAAFRKALELNAHYAEVYRSLARVALAENNYTEADALLVKSLTQEPLNPWALAYAALAELKLGNREAAIQHVRKLHSLPHAGMASVHLIAARALEEEGKRQEALAEYQVYLREAPGGANAQLARQAIARLTSPH